MIRKSAKRFPEKIMLKQRALRHDLGGDAADARTGQADGAGSAGGEVEHAAIPENVWPPDDWTDALASRQDEPSARAW